MCPGVQAQSNFWLLDDRSLSMQHTRTALVWQPVSDSTENIHDPRRCAAHIQLSGLPAEDNSHCFVDAIMRVCSVDASSET